VLYIYVYLYFRDWFLLKTIITKCNVSIFLKIKLQNAILYEIGQNTLLFYTGAN
jgi:hypothetical protein